MKEYMILIISYIVLYTDTVINLYTDTEYIAVSLTVDSKGNRKKELLGLIWDFFGTKP